MVPEKSGCSTHHDEDWDDARLDGSRRHWCTGESAKRTFHESFYLCGWEYISFARTVCKFYSIPHTALSLHLPATRSMFNTLGNVLRRCSLWLPAHLCLHAEEELAFLRKRMEEKKKKKKMRKEGRIFMALTVRRLPRMRMHVSLDV